METETTSTTASSDGTITDHPLFDSIALSMSGGGFRAAAYALGTLRGLDQLGLLDKVQILSTISGGTITGAYYALRRKQGHSFADIDRDLYALLAEDSVLPKALSSWKTAINSQQRHYKLIQAFAGVYDQHLYGQAQFGVFFEPTTEAFPTPPLQTVIFGATELYSGTAFRFQHADLPDSFTHPDGKKRISYRIGNGNVSIRPERAQQLRLGDIVAASSCFPVGFEPLVIPDDFPTKDPNNLLFFSSTDAYVNIERLALLDGGIYDNQGIEGLVLAEKRNQAYRNSPEAKTEGAVLPKPTSLYLLADVANAGMELYSTPASGPTRGSARSLGQVMQQIITSKWDLLIAVIIIAILSFFFRSAGSFWGGLFAGILLVASAIVVVIGWLWQYIQNKLQATLPELFSIALPPLKQLTLAQLRYLLKIRFSSTLELLDTVFLRRVRSLNYGLLYDNEDEAGNETSDVPTAVTMSSIIGSLLKDYQNPYYRPKLQGIIETIQTASSMGTTLWWLNDKRRMDAIIASAQITLYWRIVRHFSWQYHKASVAKKQFHIDPDNKVIYDRARKLLKEQFGVEA